MVTITMGFLENSPLLLASLPQKFLNHIVRHIACWLLETFVSAGMVDAAWERFGTDSLPVPHRAHIWGRVVAKAVGSGVSCCKGTERWSELL